jgi:hypothetical protein
MALLEAGSGGSEAPLGVVLAWQHFAPRLSVVGYRAGRHPNGACSGESGGHTTRYLNYGVSAFALFAGERWGEARSDRINT